MIRLEVVDKDYYVLVPKDVVKDLGWKSGSKVFLFIENDRIILVKGFK
jgi:AbrB family looped-hinge helix DNA binding protein